MEKQFPKATRQQQKSLHLGCTLLGKKLNDAGLNQKKVLEKLPDIIDVQWNMTSIKELYKILMTAMYGYTSTTELSTKEISSVWERLMDILMKEWGTEVNVPFPDETQTKKYLESFKK